MEHSYGFTLPFRGLQGFGMTCNALRIIHSNMLHVLGQNIPPIDVQVDYSASNKSQIDKMIIFLYFFLNFQVGVPHERCRSKMLKLHCRDVTNLSSGGVHGPPTFKKRGPTGNKKGPKRTNSLKNQQLHTEMTKIMIRNGC